MTKNLLILLLSTMLMAGCTERIDIDLGTTYTRLAVEGHITTDTTTHWVRLSKSTDYYSNTPPPPVSNAVVTVNDGFETFTLNENDTLPGYYETLPDYYGIPGRTYSLEIELQEEIHGYKSYSASCELKPVAPIDSIKVEYIEKWEAWDVKIYAWEPPSVDFYTFNIIKNGVLITDTIDEIGISDDRFFNSNYTNGATVYYLMEENPDEVVNPGDTITLIMGGVTKEYYNFIVELMDETFEYRNPLFSGPPANVSTNISNGAVGFFTAYSNTYSSTVYQGP
ncbi:MAG: DUF4249 domain-containing protein [Bacteroidetes bacterium]|nr:DUF4249 domain-containing protein [Bacteroidota bacterium]MBL7104146.1 DUF4249 domain-containing protein [Bacteroidales bacterium]